MKTIYNEKPDRTWVGGTITKKKDGTYVYSGTFKVDGVFKSDDQLTAADKAKLNDDIESELKKECNCDVNPKQDGADSQFEKQDEDPDGDGVTTGGDNCCMISNPDQQDSNGNGIGDACETPSLMLAYATSSTSVNAVFNIGLDSLSAININNYHLTSSVPVTGASIDSVGAQVVHLTTGSQTPSCDSEVLVACCVRSREGNIMPAAQQQGFRRGLCPIPMVQTQKSATNDSSQYAGEQVTISGIVTADKTAFGTHFYLEQSHAGPSSGIVTYGNIPIPVAEGDSITVAGRVREYHGSTEITSVDYLSVKSTGNAVPGPDIVTPLQLNNASSPSAERWEDVFVTINPAFVRDTTGFNSFGEWTIWDLKSAADTAMMGHEGGYTYVPSTGKFMSVQGPVSFTRGHYRIEPRGDRDIDTVNVVGVESRTSPESHVFALEQNFPNPFNPVTNIFFSIPARTNVDLNVYDVSGRLVRTLVNGVRFEPGRYRITWDGKNNADRAVTSGVYFCKLAAADKVAQMKIVILR